MGRVGLGLVGVGEGLGFEILGVDGLGLVVEGLVDLGGATAATGAANVAAAEPTMTGWVIATWRSPAGLCSTRLSGGPWRIGTSTAHFLAAMPSPNTSAGLSGAAVGQVARRRRPGRRNRRLSRIICWRCETRTESDRRLLTSSPAPCGEAAESSPRLSLRQPRLAAARSASATSSGLRGRVVSCAPAATRAADQRSPGPPRPLRPPEPRRSPRSAGPAGPAGPRPRSP